MPRLSEKTIELTTAAQMGHYSGGLMLWFGLTQAEEAQWGYDARTRIGGRLCVFQFKASSVVNAAGERRFTAHHDQMVDLRRLCRDRHGWVFYVLPLVGTREELAAHPDLIEQTWLLDVADIPEPVPAALTRDMNPRASNCHYIYALPGQARIHSEEFSVPLYPASKILGDRRGTGVAVGDISSEQTDFWSHLPLKRDIFTRRTYGAIIT